MKHFAEADIHGEDSSSQDRYNLYEGYILWQPINFNWISMFV